MEERKEEGEAEIQEHGPEHWFSKWERQCLAEAEQVSSCPRSCRRGGAAAQPEHKQQKLWHLFQNSATAVAQLYKGEGRRRRHLAPPRGWPAVGGGQPRGRGFGRRAASPPPLPARWRRARAGRGSGWGAAGARLGAGLGAPGLGPHPRGALQLGVPCPLLEAGSPAPPRGRGGKVRRSPRSQNGEGRRPRGSLLCRSRPRGGTARGRSSAALGPWLCSLALRPELRRLPGPPAADPLFSSGPPPRAGSRNLNKMAKPNMAVAE